MQDPSHFDQIDLLQTIIDYSDDGIVVVDERGNVIEWNLKQADITGLPRSTVLGRAIWDVQLQLAPPEKQTAAHLAAIKQRAQHILSGGTLPADTSLLDQVVQRADGTQRLIQSQPVPVPATHGYMIVTTVRDVTELRRLEIESRRSEARYRTLFEQASDAIMLENEHDEIIDANQRAADLVGYTRAELLKLHVSDLQAPEVRGRSGRVVADELARHAGRPFESVDLHRDGHHLPVEITETRLTVPDEGLVLTIVRDITERKQAEQVLHDHNRELAALNAELQTRNEDLDAFAHTVAHDLKNPLHVIIGFAEAVLEADESLTPDERAGALLNIARSARKMNNIIDELLLLAEVRKTQVVLQPIDLARIVADAQQRLMDMIDDSRAEIITPAAWPVVLGHAPWVEEVWVNYLSNALKYGGQPPCVELGADVLPDGVVRLWVCDNGPGLSPDIRQRLFTPFARLEQVRARGHGLGLSIVRRIVEKMGGQVGVESGESGAGSLFYFTLPQLD